RQGECCRASSAWGAGLERLTERRQGELASMLRHEAEVCECPHEAAEGRRMGLRGRCQFVNALRSASQVVGETQLSGNVEDMRHPMRRGHLHQLRMRWKCCVTDGTSRHGDNLRARPQHIYTLRSASVTQ